MIEPTETETKERLDHFADVIREILEEAAEDPEIAHTAPPTPRRCAGWTRPASPSGRWCAGTLTRRTPDPERAQDAAASGTGAM